MTAEIQDPSTGEWVVKSLNSVSCSAFGTKNIFSLSFVTLSSIQLFFLWKFVRQKCADVTSLREAFQSERECFVGRKRGGK